MLVYQTKNTITNKDDGTRCDRNILLKEEEWPLVGKGFSTALMAFRDGVVVTVVDSSA